VGAYRSAEVILPIIIDLIEPKSVVDVGSGVGAWLSYFYKRGITDITGIDGSWVKEEELLIPKDKFVRQDIEADPHTGRHTDLALCLEVGEHLTEKSARPLVKALTETAPVVLFSAAIPRQGGTAHVNEQWPEYWAVLFAEEGFIPVDAIRRRVWQDSSVEYWYAQNTLIYVKKDKLASYPKLKREVECGYSSALPLVHPRKYFYAFKRPPNIFYRLQRKVRHIFANIFRQ
jgi:SAM-dependent methyltransferase